MNTKFYIGIYPDQFQTPDQLITVVYSLPLDRESIIINEHHEILIELPDKGSVTTTDDDFGLKHIREAINPATARMFVQWFEPDDVDETRLIEHREYSPM